MAAHIHHCFWHSADKKRNVFNSPFAAWADGLRWFACVEVIKHSDDSGSHCSPLSTNTPAKKCLLGGSPRAAALLEAHFSFEHSSACEFPVIFLTALKWQNSVWNCSVACGAHAGLLHRLPQSRNLPQCKRQLTWATLSECSYRDRTSLCIREQETRRGWMHVDTWVFTV